VRFAPEYSLELEERPSARDQSKKYQLKPIGQLAEFNRLIIRPGPPKLAAPLRHRSTKPFLLELKLRPVLALPPSAQE